ncbi:Ribosomal protein S9 [Dillenia turbinata]|uniref:Ribosomal protein S9 n=1 Tax=Dillenia turbinata TaxID=194707 RepID=A0AAN8ZPQ1_9MAGN
MEKPKTLTPPLCITMLSRFISISRQTHHLCLLTLTSSPNLNPPFPFPNPNPSFFPKPSLFFSTDRNNKSHDGNNRKDQFNSNIWEISSENEDINSSLFDENDGLRASPSEETESWLKDSKTEREEGSNIFEGINKEFGGEGKKVTVDDWATADGYKPWSFADEEKDVFGIRAGDGVVQQQEMEGGGVGDADEKTVESQGKEEDAQLEQEEQALMAVLKGKPYGNIKCLPMACGTIVVRHVEAIVVEPGELDIPLPGNLMGGIPMKEAHLEGAIEEIASFNRKAFINKCPNRAFGDLIAASGITDTMLDSLFALKDLEGIEGLPSLREIEDMRYEKSFKKSTRADIERQKQEEIAKSRVRLVDEKGRAYGTGIRKCSIARVWVQPGDGKFMINDKQFDVYFPMLDHRAALLRPFSERKTLGLWDVNCTVKGGGMSGQVGAIRLGISRAVQNWEPGLRPSLREGQLVSCSFMPICSLLRLTDWVFNKGFPGRREEKAWKSEGKKELPMGQAMAGDELLSNVNAGLRQCFDIVIN